MCLIINLALIPLKICLVSSYELFRILILLKLLIRAKICRIFKLMQNMVLFGDSC